MVFKDILISPISDIKGNQHTYVFVLMLPYVSNCCGVAQSEMDLIQK